MSKIIQLSEEQINYLGSGEILNKPSQIVKELIENSIDAFSSKISVELFFKDQKLISIKVRDNGNGINLSDFKNLCKRYHTSKIQDYNDLSKIDTLGFRGEALNAISLNSLLTIQSNDQKESNIGNQIIFFKGCPTKQSVVPMIQGTCISVENIFGRNSKKQNALLNQMDNLIDIELLVKSFAINYDISFELLCNQKQFFKSLQSSDKKENIKHTFEQLKNSDLFFLEENFENKSLNFQTFYTLPNALSNFKMIIIWMNNRLIKNNKFEQAIKNAYKDSLMMSTNQKIKSYFAYIKIDVNFRLLDINLQANKGQVKLIKEKEIYKFISEIFQSKLTESMNIKKYQSKKIVFDYPNKQITENMRDISEQKKVIFNRNDFNEVKITHYSQPVIQQSQIKTLEQKNIGKNLDQNPLKMIQNLKSKENFINPIEESDRLLLEATYVGFSTPFLIFIQNDETLYEFQSFDFLQKYFEDILYQEFYYQKLKKFSYDISPLEQKTFEKFQTLNESILNYVKNDNNYLQGKINQYNQQEINSEFLQKSQEQISIIIEPQLSSIINPLTLEYLNIFLFSQFLQQKENYQQIYRKFIMFLLQFSEENQKPHINYLYQQIFIELKQKKFFFKIDSNKNTLTRLINLKSMYKIFERCQFIYIQTFITKIIFLLFFFLQKIFFSNKKIEENFQNKNKYFQHKNSCKQYQDIKLFFFKTKKIIFKKLQEKVFSKKQKKQNGFLQLQESKVAIPKSKFKKQQRKNENKGQIEKKCISDLFSQNQVQNKQASNPNFRTNSFQTTMNQDINNDN